MPRIAPVGTPGGGGGTRVFGGGGTSSFVDFGTVGGGGNFGFADTVFVCGLRHLRENM